MLLALQAGANGLPFTPVLGFLNTDYMKVRQDLHVVKDPFSGNDYVVVPPIIPDVAVIHAFKGDHNGAVITDSFRNDRLLAMAAKKTIAIVEEIVDPDDVVPGKYGVYVSALHVDAVVLAAHGAHPTSCRGKYGLDPTHIMTYMQATKTEESFKAYLEKYITGPENHEAYLEEVGLGGKND